MRFFSIKNILFLVVFATGQLYAQKVRIQLQDSTSKEPIAFAHITYNKSKGTLTNEEGFFETDLAFIKGDSVRVTSIGYIEKTYAKSHLQGLKTILLKPNVEELETVFVFDEKINIQSIIDSTRKHLPNNYKLEEQMFRLFSRESGFSRMKNIVFEIRRADGASKKEIKTINKELKKMSNSFSNRTLSSFRDGLVDLYMKDSLRAKFLKETELKNKSQSLDLENVQNRINEIVLKNLNPNSTYKLKTGILKLADSISIKTLESEKNEVSKIETHHQKHHRYKLLTNVGIKEKSVISKILSPKMYHFKLDDFTYSGGTLLYVVSFSPRKSKANLEGKLYISEDDFAIHKVEYKFGEGEKGNSVNLKLLLGIKFYEYGKSGIVIYEKKGDYYQPKYGYEKVNQYFYFNRKLKLIENEAEKNKYKLKIILEGNSTQINEFLVLQTESINKNAFESVKETGEVAIEQIGKYNPKIWEAYNILAPLEAMKAYGNQ